MSKNWLRNCDLLHIPMSLSYKNEYFYTTTVGAILTIICILIVLSISLYEIKSLSEKSSFSIITNQYTDISENIDFAKRPLLFQLIDNAGQIMEEDDKLFEFKAVDMEWIVKINQNGKQEYKVINTVLNMEKCDKVLQKFPEYLSSIDLSKYYCIDNGHNITSYGYLGDMDNGYKGFRIYLNKCNNNNCYTESEILSKLSNIKFRVSYLGLNTNIFSIGSTEFNYRMISRACSISTNILKKIYFTFSVGRFYLFNNIFSKKKKIFNYIIGNNPITDIDLDPSSTVDKNRDTLAYFSFNFDGGVVEITKEVKSFYNTLSFIGNTFNIALTIIKIINNYYSNKVLFVDIFKTFFYLKDDKNTKKAFKRDQLKFFKKYKNNNNNNQNNQNNNNIFMNNSKKNVLDLSDSIGLNNANNSSVLKKSKSNNKMAITIDKSNIKRKLSIISIDNKEKKVKNKLIYYYVFPLCILRKNKTFNSVCIIKDKICTYFSIEKLHELSKFKESLDQKVKKVISNTELLKLSKKFDSNDSMDYHDKNKKS